MFGTDAPHAPPRRMANEFSQRDGLSMFKIIGATVVYGFALFGLCTWLTTKDEESHNHCGER